MTYEPGMRCGRKFVPITFSVRSDDPTIALVGEIELIDGLMMSGVGGV